MKSVKFLLVICFIFIGCGNHECCGHKQYEIEREAYKNRISSKELNDYNKCKEDNRTQAYIKCYVGNLAEVIIQRCVEDLLHRACK